MERSACVMDGQLEPNSNVDDESMLRRARLLAAVVIDIVLCHYLLTRLGVLGRPTKTHHVDTNRL